MATIVLEEYAWVNRPVTTAAVDPKVCMSKQPEVLGKYSALEGAETLVLIRLTKGLKFRPLPDIGWLFQFSWNFAQSSSISGRKR